jgi:4-hydroxy 2-oxovalerate aldolase
MEDIPMAQKGDLLSVRQDIRVVDATIRDGGLCNNFRFDDKFIKDLYQANVKAGVDYMEFGYKASKEIFNEDDFGKWKFCNDSDIRKIVGDNKTGLKIAVMADVGRTDFQKDIIPKKDSPIDLIRIATYINTIPAAVEMIENCAKKGYETTINIMAVSKANTDDIKTALDILGQSPVNAFYIVDSYGALYPEQSRKLANLYCEYADKYGKSVGIHAHNNQQLAFANTIEAMTQGVSYLDATVDGMGRGAGNCALELLLGFLKNPKYKVAPILKIIEEHTEKLKAEGVKWGYDIPYMLTGQLNTHPRPAISYVKEDRKDYSKFANELYDIINS